MQCKYGMCSRRVISDESLCILHEKLKEDNRDSKIQEFNKDISKGICDFEGCILPDINLTNKVFQDILNFQKTKIDGDACFDNVKAGNILFDGAEIRGDCSFFEAKISGDVLFNQVKIGGDALFGRSEISADVFFVKAKITGDVDFCGARVGREISFGEATIGKDVNFEDTRITGGCNFGRAKIDGDAVFNSTEIGGSLGLAEVDIQESVVFYGDFQKGALEKRAIAPIPPKAKIGGTLSLYKGKVGGDALFAEAEIGGVLFLRKAQFKKPGAQEEGCRKAKMIYQNLGDRIESDYYFYREMEAKRKQKNAVVRFLELPIQYVFGYGVCPSRVIVTWLSVVFVLAFIYWAGKGVKDADSFWTYLYFSVVTAATPGYGGYYPKSGFFQGLATFQAVFGTFMWATFVATFARKFMR